MKIAKEMDNCRMEHVFVVSGKAISHTGRNRWLPCLLMLAGGCLDFGGGMLSKEGNIAFDSQIL